MSEAQGHSEWINANGKLEVAQDVASYVEGRLTAALATLVETEAFLVEPANV